ncbi:MAG: hypothetical protein WAK60_00905 [Sedimentisphaerales bacterium]
MTRSFLWMQAGTDFGQRTSGLSLAMVLDIANRGLDKFCHRWIKHGTQRINKKYFSSLRNSFCSKRAYLP